MNGATASVVWKIAEVDRARVQELASQLGVPRVIAHMLMTRNLQTAEDCEHFLSPSAEHLSNPFELADMDSAVARVQQARDHGHHVRIFGDYDVDGISGTALLYRALKQYGIEHCSYALPNRLVDGYGLSPDKVFEAKEEGVDLLITVDNGIKAHDAADAARQAGLDLIITDHHTIEGDLPSANAVINPKRHEPSFPFYELSGSAVAHKLASALIGDDADLGLAALGTVADIVPLHRENRAVVALGIKRLVNDPPPGLVALASCARISLDDLRAENIAFQLGPRINAGGRIGDGTLGLKLLLTDSTQDARRLASELDATNTERRSIERKILTDVEEELAAEFDPEQRTLVLAREGWHHGVVGIVAAKLQHAYHRPVVLIALDENGTGKASGRSTPDFDIVAGLSACRDLLVRFGGHKAAAGMTIERHRVDAFKEAFEQEARRLLSPGERVKELAVDAMVGLSEIDSQLLQNLDRLEPFGHGNPSPLFCSYGVEVLPNSARELRGGHLKLALRQGSTVLTAIGFNMADKLPPGETPTQANVAFTPKFNTWQGQTSIQLHLKDIEFCD